MKLETEIFGRVARGPLYAGRPRSGVALVITLTIMALLLILGTAFVVNMRGERQVSFNYRRQVEARQAALAGLHTAVAKMKTFYSYAEAANASVQTMAGRFYYTVGTNGFIGINKNKIGQGLSGSISLMTASNMLMFSHDFRSQLFETQSDGTIKTNIADKVDMNVGSYNVTAPLSSSQPQQSDYYLPIANPSVHPNRKWTAERVGVWAANISAGNAKFAFWIDDEQSKINISNAGARSLIAAPCSFDNNTTNTWVQPAWPATPLPPGSCQPYPCAMIVQPDSTKGITKQLSTVDLAILDNKVVNTAETAFPSQQNWGDSSTLSSLESVRNAGVWQEFQWPDDVLGIPSALNMQDYQAVKPCLTAWSVEKDELTQMFRNASGLPVPRTNVSVAIKSAPEAKSLYDFMMTTTSLKNSTHLRKHFNNAIFQSKYTGTTNGSVEQIAANIVSYITDPEKPNNPPYGAGVSGYPNLPSGPCGLWKAAYMNEIAFGFYWQKKVDPPVPPAVVGSTKYQLWAAMYVELINPYEVELPRTDKSEYYTINVDPDVEGNPPLAFTITWAPPTVSVPAARGLPVGNNNYSIDVIHSIKPHAYSSTAAETDAANSPVPWTKWQWPITGVITTNRPPDFTKIEIKMPKSIRLTMNNGKSMGLIDWYDRAQLRPRLDKLTLSACKPTEWVVPTMDVPLGYSPNHPVPPSVDAAFWLRSNPARISIAKNDPRVRQWYGQTGAGETTPKGIVGHGDNTVYGVTLKVPDNNGAVPGWGDNHGQNPIGNINYSDGTGGIVDFRGGDVEILNSTYAKNANRPEYRSNFAIAETGMKSLGELGFIHTGRPWRSLSLQRYGTQPGEAAASTSAWIPDWAMLDLFTVNSTPIYGRVNINNGGWHLGNYTAGTYYGKPDPSFEDMPKAPLLPNMVANWRSAIEEWYNGANSQWVFYTLRTSAYNRFAYAPMRNLGNSQADAGSLPVAAALNVIPNYKFRNQLANFITFRATNMVSNVPQFIYPYQPYVIPAEICEVATMTNLFYGTGTQAAYTDADREDTFRRISNVLTTHGDVFTVHVIGAQDSGEARLAAVVEHSYDPTQTYYMDRHKFRIRNIRWITEQ